MSTTNTWSIDPTHSEIGFSVKHMMFSKVRGTFEEFTANITADDQFQSTDIQVNIEAKSVNTRNEQRDAHLVSAEFFDAEQFPKLTFQVAAGDMKSGKIPGKLSIKGIEKEVVLDIDFHGEGKDPWGNIRAAFAFESELNREDFGLTWNVPLEAGGVLVGKTVTLSGEIQLVKA
jgi:polyisoprenoid-binding protein YceI